MAPLPPVGEALFGLLHVYKRALRERYIAAGMTLPLSHLRVLGEIGRHEGVMAREIAAALLQDKGLITRVTRELEREGLIERHPHPTDSRAFHLTLTAEGRALHQRVVRIERELQARMIGDLEHHQLNHVIHTLSAMADNLDHPQEDA